MAKIDCSVTVNFLKELVRMCKISPCKECPVNELARESNASCGWYLSHNADLAVEIVQKWSDENPVKTRLDDLLEKYPNMQLVGEGIPCFSPAVLDYCGDCGRCRNWKVLDMRKCWNEPVDGGATGKAVE